MSLNTNSIHNILNLILGLVGILTTILVGLGCTQIGDRLDCTMASVPAWLLPWLLGIAGLIGMLKTVMNLVRDGFKGLWKQQPPVATDMKTVVVTGDKDSVTEVKTVTPGATVIKG